MNKRFQAFTLIELLVVIAIIGILTGFIFVSMNGAVNSAKDARREADISNISKAIMEYMAQNNNAYPYTATTTACNLCNNDSCTNPCTGFYANIQPYMPNIPVDPNGAYYTYTYSATPKFVLQTTLSNTYAYQYDSTSGFSTVSYASTCTAATNAQVNCTPITISSTEEVCRCTYLSGAGTTTWTTPNNVTQVQYLVIGGGGGGSTGGNYGGGGGAGKVSTASGFSVSGNITLTIGVGGSSAAAGSSSIFSSITSTGGSAGSGTSGGASGNGYTGGSGSNSIPVGGGGGAGSAGNGNSNHSGGDGCGGDGGIGTYSSITGSSVYYAGGGGGAGASIGGAYGGAGIAGGGNGATGSSPGTGYNATASTGSGGGGAVNATAGSGGSGIVIIRYTHP
jgi:type II secretion system protein G